MFEYKMKVNYMLIVTVKASQDHTAFKQAAKIFETLKKNKDARVDGLGNLSTITIDSKKELPK